MKNKIRKKSLNYQIFLFIGIIFCILCVAEVLVTNIVKTNYKRSLEKMFNEKTEIVKDATYNDLLALYHEGYYVIDLKADKINPISTITINSVAYKTIISSPINIGDKITFEINDGFLTISSTGTSGIVQAITSPDNINFLTADLPYINNILIADKSKHSIEYEQNTIFYSYIDNYLIIQQIDLAEKLFTTINLFQAVLLLLFMLIIIICGYVVNYYFIYPIVEMTEISNNFLKGKFSHTKLDYPNSSYRILGESVNRIGEELQKVHKELNQKRIEVENYIKRSEEDYHFNKQLVANISHEIKTPLAIIQATICAIQDGIFEGDEINEEYNNVLAEIDKTNKMLQEIVGLYKMESTSFKLDIQDINLDELLNNKLQEFEKIALKYDQQLSYQGVENLIIQADKTQIERIINNIILNAITYSPVGNKVTIETRKTNKYSVLEIINYGITIDNHDLENIFEPFYRADRSRKKSEDHGNGLGLYYVKQMLDKHNFDFGMENVINGVRFYIIFEKKD